MNLKAQLKHLTEEKKSESKEKNKQVITNEIRSMFRKNSKPEDSVIHALSDKLHIDAHEFEDKIYEIIGSFIGSGDSVKSKFEDKDADPKQLEIGTLVEMEHTSNKDNAKKIALDHLSVVDNYYTRLIHAGLVDEKEALNLHKKYYPDEKGEK